MGVTRWFQRGSKKFRGGLKKFPTSEDFRGLEGIFQNGVSRSFREFWEWFPGFMKTSKGDSEEFKVIQEAS